MPGPKRTPTERVQQRALIADLLLKNWTQTAIGEHLKLSQSQVSRELRRIKEDWKKESNRDFDLSVEQELKRLELIERTYWQAWDKSLQPKESTSSEKKGSEVKVGKRTEQRAGNPQFLKGVMECIDRRCKLLGLDAPVKSEITSEIAISQVQEDYHAMDAEELSRLYIAKLQNPHQN